MGLFGMERCDVIIWWHHIYAIFLLLLIFAWQCYLFYKSSSKIVDSLAHNSIWYFEPSLVSVWMTYSTFMLQFLLFSRIYGSFKQSSLLSSRIYNITFCDYQEIFIAMSFFFFDLSFSRNFLRTTWDFALNDVDISIYNINKLRGIQMKEKRRGVMWIKFRIYRQG